MNSRLQGAPSQILEVGALSYAAAPQIQYGDPCTSTLKSLPLPVRFPALCDGANVGLGCGAASAQGACILHKGFVGFWFGICHLPSGCYFIKYLRDSCVVFIVSLLNLPLHSPHSLPYSCLPHFKLV